MTISELGTTRGRERRTGDRRRRATPAISRYTLFGGRRAGDRRSAASTNVYVDLYEPRVALALVVIGIMCALDAGFTLMYLQKGGTEANPIMAAAIEWGPLQFVILKCGFTNFGLCVLLLHQNFRWVRGVVGALVGMYAALIFYHLFLALMLV